MIRLSDRHYPYTRQQLQADHPRASIPRDLTPAQAAALGAALVVRLPRPAPDHGMRVIEAAPALVDEVWTQQWAQVPADPEPVPESVPGPRMVALLMRLGRWQPVADMIDQVIPEPQRTLARISLSGDWPRTGPMIVAAQAWLGWGDELVDEWFRMAPREPIQ